MTETQSGRWARWARPVAFGAAGLLAGGLLAGSLTASAGESAGTDQEGDRTSTAPSAPADPSQPQRGDEELLTGSTARKVEAAALAEHPGATVLRVETDSDGVYEAHLVTADGEPVTVEVGEDFAVTGTEAHGGSPGPGGPGVKGERPDAADDTASTT